MKQVFILNSLSILFIFFIHLMSIDAQTIVEFETDSAYIDGTIVVNREYSLPTVDGADGQVLTSNGSGQSSWMSPSSSGSDDGTYVYLAPFVCGYQDHGILPTHYNRNKGQYQTSISILNPAHEDMILSRTLSLTHNRSDTLIPPDAIQAPADTIFTDTLSRFYTFAMTCDEIYDVLISEDLISPLTTTFEGHVIIESDEKIAVSAAYTYFDSDFLLDFIPIQQGGGGAGGIGLGVSIDVETIDPIFIPTPAP